MCLALGDVEEGTVLTTLLTTLTLGYPRSLVGWLVCGDQTSSLATCTQHEIF